MAKISEFKKEYKEMSEALYSAFALYVVNFLGWQEYLENELTSDFSPHKKIKVQVIDLCEKLCKNFSRGFMNGFQRAVNEIRLIHQKKLAKLALGGNWKRTPIM